MDSASADKIDRLYQIYDVLSEAKDITEHVSEYKQILDAVKGSSKEKVLASQFIGKFFKNFPALQELAIDRQLDLCEDSDALIRKQAIKDLPLLCKDNKDNVPKISDSLAQLLSVLENGVELQQANVSLEALVKIDAKGTLMGIISQIISGDEVTRECCFKYLTNKFATYGKEIITKEVEEYLIAEIKKVLQDVTADEFHHCMNILGTTKLGKTITGHNELVQLATEQAELNSEVSSLTYDDEIVERFIQCANHALPYFSKIIESTAFIRFICEKLLPLDIWSVIGVADDQDQVQLRLLKVFAALCACCGKLENADELIDRIYQVLIEYMPLPSLDTDDAINENPSFKFSHVECLLYAIHSIGKLSPEFLTFPQDATKLRDFRARLQYLARGTQGYIKKLQEAVKGKTAEELKEEENQIKVTALRITSNISVLIRDLFHTTPTYKAKIDLSWIVKKKEEPKPAAESTTNGSGADAFGGQNRKRRAPITFEGKAANGNKNKNNNNSNNANKGHGGKKQRLSNDNQKMYQPPSGKYSAKMDNYSNGNGQRQQQRGGGDGGAGGNWNRRNRGGGGGGGGGGGFRRSGGEKGGGGGGGNRRRFNNNRRY